jgi:3-oxoacyl-[acyl-carrier protein] reductase
MGNTGQVAYAAAKAGLIGVTKSLARELASRAITVNCVSPGFIETDMTEKYIQGEAREALLKQIPLGRIGSATDVAEAVRFLCSPQASYVTGQVIRVNGGLLM